MKCGFIKCSVHFIENPMWNLLIVFFHLNTNIWRIQIPYLEIYAVIEIMAVTLKPQIAFNVLQELLTHHALL